MLTNACAIFYYTNAYALYCNIDAYTTYDNINTNINTRYNIIHISLHAHYNPPPRK